MADESGLSEFLDTLELLEDSKVTDQGTPTLEALMNEYVAGFIVLLKKIGELAKTDKKVELNAALGQLSSICWKYRESVETFNATVDSKEQIPLEETDSIKTHSKDCFIDTIDVTLDKASATVDDNGVMHIPSVVIAREMVQDYDGLKVLKPGDELEAAAPFCDGRPITDEHPAERIVTDRTEVKGSKKKPVWNKDKKELSVDFEITDKTLQDSINSGDKQEVSIGFSCDLDRTSGELDGKKYDAIQKDIYIDHTAVCKTGTARCSLKDGCGIDSKTLSMASKDDITKIKDSVKRIVDERNTLTKERDGLRKMVDSFTEDAKKDIIDELTSLQDTKDESALEKMTLCDLQKELDMVKEIKGGAKKLGAADNDSGQSAIDEAYASIGKK